jgi:hypothetical protein
VFKEILQGHYTEDIKTEFKSMLGLSAGCLLKVLQMLGREGVGNSDASERACLTFSPTPGPA